MEVPLQIFKLFIIRPPHTGTRWISCKKILAIQRIIVYIYDS